MVPGFHLPHTVITLLDCSCTAVGVVQGGRGGVKFIECVCSLPAGSPIATLQWGRGGDELGVTLVAVTSDPDAKDPEWEETYCGVYDTDWSDLPVRMKMNIL